MKNMRADVRAIAAQFGFYDVEDGEMNVRWTAELEKATKGAFIDKFGPPHVVHPNGALNWKLSSKRTLVWAVVNDGSSDVIGISVI